MTIHYIQALLRDCFGTFLGWNVPPISSKGYIQDSPEMEPFNMDRSTCELPRLSEL